MTTRAVATEVERAINDHGGVLPLEPAWVARNVIPAGGRLGLAEDMYTLGDRGWITERWLASTTRAENDVGPPDEGLSYLALGGSARVSLRDAIAAVPDAIMGSSYAATHAGLGRLAKILDYGARSPYHIHPTAEYARLVGRSPKEESYYFLPGAALGPQPEIFFGVHPSVTETTGPDLLLPHLVAWNSDRILQHSRAYLQVAGEGFHVPAGVLHAPGTALTFELQEDSDTASIFQALVAGKLLSKELLFHDVRAADRRREGERFLLKWIDWSLNRDPHFYEHRRLEPLRAGMDQPGGEESWIFYNSTKYSGKQLVVRPGMAYTAVEAGVYSVFVWRGGGRIAGHRVRAGNPESDEVIVVHDCAVSAHEVVNDGRDDLVLIKFFGPDMNPDMPVTAANEP